MNNKENDPLDEFVIRLFVKTNNIDEILYREIPRFQRRLKRLKLVKESNLVDHELTDG